MSVVGFLNGDLTTLDLTSEDATMQAVTADSLLFTQSLTPAESILDSYSAGTFTVNIAGDVTPGTPTYAANGNVGRYERIGNRVWISIALSWTDLAGSAGNLIASGLPYTPATLAAGFVNLAWDIKTNWGVLGGNVLPSTGISDLTTSIPVARINQGVDAVQLWVYETVGGANTQLTVKNSGSFYLNGFYEV